jgi:hypothetical protein
MQDAAGDAVRGLQPLRAMRPARSEKVEHVMLISTGDYESRSRFRSFRADPLACGATIETKRLAN